MSTRFIRVGDLASTKDRQGRWPVAPATIWRWVSTGILPPPVALGPGVTAWPMAVIEAHEAKAPPASPDAAMSLQAKAGVRSVEVRRARRQAKEAQ